MKTKTLLFCVIFFISQITSAQINDIEIISKRNNDNSLTFSYKKQKYGSYFLSVWFPTLNNAYSSGINCVVSNVGNELFSIQPENENLGINYSYKWWYIRGIPNPKFNPNFVYALPTNTSQYTNISKMTNVETEYFGSSSPNNWQAYLFRTPAGDTVFTARKGIVVEIINDQNYNTSQIILYQSKINKILIEHQDGTFASYKGFEKDKIFVTEGQTVFPGTPLGTIAKYDKTGQGQLRFSVYYLNYSKPDKSNNRTYKNKIQYYAFVEPIFHTTEGDIKLESNKAYKAVVDDELITKEFTKKEKRKLYKGKIDIKKLRH